MSGAVKQIKRGIESAFGGDSRPAEPVRQAAAEAPQPAARAATAEERAIALRRRRGTRALLSQERIDAEMGLGGDQTTLGGM